MESSWEGVSRSEQSHTYRPTNVGEPLSGLGVLEALLVVKRNSAFARATWTKCGKWQSDV